MFRQTLRHGRRRSDQPRRTPRRATRVAVEFLEARLVLSTASSSLNLTVAQAIGVAGTDQIFRLHGMTNPSINPALSVQPTRAESFTINQNLLEQVLARAPLEFTPQANAAPLAFALPKPDGTLERFALVNAPIADPILAAEFPNIQTYRGQGIDDPTETVRLDVTPLGFHAQVLSTAGSYYIDPAVHMSTAQYLSYYKRDLPQSQPFEFFEEANENENAPPIPGTALRGGGSGTSMSLPSLTPQVVPTVAPAAAGRSSGSVLRTYRLAVAADGEYSQFFGGTVNAALSAVITTVNRVVGIYETELAIRMVLVANEAAIIYTNPATDPYSNTNPSSLLAQNQRNLDTVIGSANYDIGHVFTTGGGGLAGLGVVGNSTRKAQGETGLPNPVGDAYAVDYVAHEMGHQFGGNHTFNTRSDGNRNAATAYEPGSGTTIMAYAGVDGPGVDLQPNSDPYFAWISFDEIIRYVDVTIPNVGVRTSTGNSIPTVSAGPSTYVIPTGTPFVLTASGSDADGDLLTYSWEEADLGPATNPGDADNGQSPLFRVFNPTTSPSRTFPRLSDLVNNTTVFGEKLPTVARAALKFRVTVRDNRSGGGGVNSDDTSVRVVNTGSVFAVTGPNTAVTWSGGATQTVTWNVAGTTGNGINTANVRILLSTDGGLTYGTVLLASTPNNGSATITTPNITTTTARIRVEAIGNIFFDISNANFRITPAVAPTVVGLTSTTTNGAYGIGVSIPIQISFSAPVTVTGSPVLALNSGGSAVYSSGSGTATLTFLYTIASGQSSTDLDASTTSALTLNGGTITGAGTTAASLTLPTPGATGSLGATKNLVVDGIAPTVVAYRLLFGTQSYNLIGSTRVNLPWQVTGVQAVFSEPINAGALASLGGLAATSFSGLGTSTLTWVINPLSKGIIQSTLLAHGGNALRDTVGNALGVGTDFTQNFRVLYGDANDDGVVDSADLATVFANTVQMYNIFDDLNGDGVVDLNDVRIARSRIGQSILS